MPEPDRPDPAMPATPDHLFDYLGRIGIAVLTELHAPLRTVEDAKAHRVGGAAGHSKTLFVRDAKGRLSWSSWPRTGWSTSNACPS